MRMNLCMSIDQPRAQASDATRLRSRLVGVRSMFPCGLTRREALWEMGGGFAGLALLALLDADKVFAAEAKPQAARIPHFQGKARSVIFLMMNGAPSQVDTFDYKPALKKYAGQTLPQDKKYI